MTDNNKNKETYSETFFTIPAYILDLPGMTLGYLKVYWTFFQFWNKRLPCYLSNPAIMERTNLKKSQVSEALTYFENNGELVREQRGSKRYLLKPEKPIEWSDNTQPPATAVPSTTNAQPPATAGGGTRYSGMQPPATAVPEYKEENIKKLITTSFSYPDTLYQSTETSILLCEKKKSDESFDLFYEIYPVQKNENRARNAWLAQRCWERFEEIITALNELKSHDAHFKDGYAPNPDKWILEEKWKDKPVKRKSRNSSQAYTVEDSSHSTWGNSKKGLI